MASKLKSRLLNVTLGELLRNTDGTLNVSANPRQAESYDRTQPDYRTLRESIVSSMNRDGKGAIISSGLKVNPELREIDVPEGYKFLAPSGRLFQIVRGHRRLVIVDRETGGYPDNASFEVQCVVYSKMSDLDFMDYLLDQGETKDLTPVEVYVAIAKGTEAGLDETALAVKFRRLLERMGRPLTSKDWEKIGDLNDPDPSARAQAETNLKNRFRGQIRNHVWVSKMPDEVQNAWMQSLKKTPGFNYPTSSEVIDLYSVFNEEIKGPLYTRANPGPKFLARWQKILDARAKAAEEGSKARSTAMKAVKDVRDVKIKSESRFEKIILCNILNELPTDPYKAAIKLLVRLESRMSPEEVKELTTLFGAASEEPVTNGAAPAPQSEVPAAAKEVPAAAPTPDAKETANTGENEASEAA